MISDELREKAQAYYDAQKTLHEIGLTNVYDKTLEERIELDISYNRAMAAVVETKMAYNKALAQA